MDTETPKAETKRIVGVQFSRSGKIEYYLAGDIELSLHNMVVVRGEYGDVVGTVIVPPKEVAAANVAMNMKEVVRKATEEDIDKHDESKELASEAFNLCEEKILEQNLSMKLVDVTLEGKKAIFFFFAEERVDFRTLVKELANALHMRIEMRQIGARDEAKGIGALGPCGLICCCEAHLREFASISISMAKNQGLSPNPSKLTGMCGKLKCCMAYENAFYVEERKTLPPIGSAVDTPKGKGFITTLDVPRRLCHVKLDTEEGNEGFRISCDECHVLEKAKRIEREDEDKEYEKFEG